VKKSEEIAAAAQTTPHQAAAAKTAEAGGRLASLDAFRGFDILVMVFVNYIAGMKFIPFILRHAAAEMDTYTLTDLVFPGFLFIVGVAIPLSLGKRTAAGTSLGRVLVRVAVRTVGLLFLGVIMVNQDRFSAADTGISEQLWYLLAYLAVIALWMIYPRIENRRRRALYLGLRLGAVLVLLVLVIIFRGRTESGAVVWLQPQWWGILGQIGWAYLLCSLLFLGFGRSRAALMGFLGLLIALNAGNYLGALNFLKGTWAADMLPGVSCHTAIALAGVIVGTWFAPYQIKQNPKSRSLFILSFGVGLYVAAVLLRPVQGISKIRATQSYALASAGLCALAFLGFYLLLDVLKIRRWSEFLKPVGMNPLLAYILPDILISALWLFSKIAGHDLGRFLWPFAERGGVPGMLNALAVTGLILLITAAATRWKIILRL
jgi:heparan-alpha-glucosaminide N-acetyltransferase